MKNCRILINCIERDSHHLYMRCLKSFQFFFQFKSLVFHIFFLLEHKIFGRSTSTELMASEKRLKNYEGIDIDMDDSDDELEKNYLLISALLRIFIHIFFFLSGSFF